MFKNRSSEKEIMDDLNCSGEVLKRTLYEIEYINHWLGGDAIILNGLNKIIKNKSVNGKLSIADLGCGGGGMLKILNRWSERNGIKTELTGIDANPNIIALATNDYRAENVRFETMNILDHDFKKQSYDIILCTLLLHHFTNQELIGLISQLKNQVKIALIVNDLHRHPFAYYSIKWLTGLFSKSEMVKFDAPLSVKRGFLREELYEILDEAGIENFHLTWKWAFRWQLIIV